MKTSVVFECQVSLKTVTVGLKLFNCNKHERASTFFERDLMLGERILKDYCSQSTGFSSGV